MYSQSCTLANTPHVPKSIHEIHTLMSVLRKTRDPRGGSGGGGLERYQEFLVGLDRVEKVSWRKGCSLFTRVGLESELEEAINYIRYQQSEAKRHSSTTASVNRHPLLDPLTRLYTAIKKEDGVVDFDLVLVLVVKVHSLSHHHQQGSGSLGGGLWGLEGIAESVEVAAWEALEFGVEGMIDW
ncbi:hypothetical protein BDR26DRAFT_850581 [Obelidium mucronatum]|nr:hypothetical protein BDR26DRAFT_850581 [Obelidium mucronatum]